MGTKVGGSACVDWDTFRLSTYVIDFLVENYYRYYHYSAITTILYCSSID